MDQEYISVSQAKRELGEDGFLSLERWMRDKGYINFDQLDELHWVRSKKFITQKQLKEFVTEQLKEFKGQNLTEMWGQTKEHYNGRKHTTTQTRRY